MTDVIVVAKRLRDDVVIEGWFFGESGYEPYDQIPPIPDTMPPPYTTWPLQVTCDSAGKVAKRVSNYLRDHVIPANSSEFSAVVVGAGGGLFKLFLDGMVTLDDVDQTAVITPAGHPASVALIFHNHPGNIVPDPSRYNAVNRYPSLRDWEAAGRMVAAGNVNSNIKLAIQSRDWDVRIYNYSDRQSYENLTEQQKVDGVGLPSPVTSTVGCS